MSADPFVIHGSFPNDNSKNKGISNLFLQKTFLCMESLKNNEISIKRENPISFDCKQYERIEDATDKLFEEEKNNHRRMKIVQIPIIVPESLTDDVLCHILKKQYWGIVRKI